MRKCSYVKIYVGYCERCGARVSDDEMAASIAAGSHLLLCRNCLIFAARIEDKRSSMWRHRPKPLLRIQRRREGFWSRRASPAFIFCAFGLTVGGLLLFAALVVGKNSPSADSGVTPPQQVVNSRHQIAPVKSEGGK